MMKQLKKVISIICAIALLFTSMTFALAEENPEDIAAQTAAAEEAAAQAAAEEAAAQAAAEEAAAQAAAEEAAAQAAAEEAAAQAAAEEAAAAQAAAEEAAAEEAAAQAAAEEAAAEEAAAQAAAEEAAAAQAAAEEAAAQAAAEEAAAAQAAAEEAAAAQAAAEEAAAAQAAAEEAAAQAAAEEAAAAQAAAEEAAAQAAAEEAAEEEASEEEAAEETPVEETPAEETPAEETPAEETPAEETPAEETPAEEVPVEETPVEETPAEETPEEEAAEEEAAEEEAAAEEAAEEEAAEEEAAEEEASEEEAAEEEASEEEASEEEASEEEASEEEAAEEETSEEASDITEEEEDEDGLVQLEDDSEGYVDQEVIEENTPAITDELKGLRFADLIVGNVLTESLRFGDELTVTLKGCNVSTVNLMLYVPYGASINTKVDGKPVSFTPADSDVPSMNLYVYELTNAAGRNHEIVLTSYDTVTFSLYASVNQVEETTEEPAAEEEETPAAEDSTETPTAAEETPETPAEEPAEETSDSEIPDETPAETPAPTLQTSVKTYDALKAGRSTSDTLIAGQKAKIQVKCGKNPYVTLTLSANPDDVYVTIDGQAAEFTAAGNGTYTCDLDDVAFRKFSVVIAAKQDLAFTLSAEARQVEETPAPEDAEADDSINMEETAEETSEEIAEEVTEEAAEESEEVSEETEEADVPEEGEEAEGEEENTEEETEETEPLTDEQLAELGYRKVQVLNKDGADIYAGTEDAEAIGHADFESELWIKDAEAEGWAEIYTEEETKQFIKLAEIEKQPLTDEEIAELGFRKVQILNQKGTDIYGAAEEEAAVIGHAEFESELWIRDLEAEGWAEIFTEEETKQYVMLAEIEKQMPSDAEMLEAGYIRVYVAIDIGANIYETSNEYEGEEATDHLEVGTELWVKLIENAGRAQIFDLDDEAPARYINLVDIVATMKPEGMEELPTRELIIVSSLDEAETVKAGTINRLEAQLINFREDDNYKVQWKYSEDGETFIDIEDAVNLEFAYMVTMDNGAYIWRVSVVLVTPEDVGPEETVQEE